MRFPTASITTLLLAALPTALALTITSPTANQQINPGLPLTITWTTTPSDPSTITLILIHSSTSSTTLATSIPASDGTYTVPAWWVLDWGTGYTLEAQANGGGAVLTQVADLSLAGGVGEVTTDASGALSFVSTAGLATASQEPGAASTGSDGEPLLTILSGDATASATETGTESADATETGAEESASATTSESESASESASATESTAAAASETAGGAAGGLRVAAGGVLGALVVALMA